MKDDEEPNPLAFYLISVDLGEDANGEKIKSAVLEYKGAGLRSSARLTPAELLGVATFREAAAELGHSLLDLNPPKLYVDQWRTAFYRRSTQADPDSKRRAFDRMRAKLNEKGWLKVEDNIYTLIVRTPRQNLDSLVKEKGPLDWQDPDGQDTPLRGVRCPALEVILLVVFDKSSTNTPSV